MPSPAARALTTRHRAELEQVRAVVVRRMRSLASGASTADIDAWWASIEPRVVRLVERGSQAAATLAESYLRRHAALEGVSLSPVRSLPGRAAIRDSMRITGPVAFKSHMARTGSEAASLRTMADRMSGAASRHAMNGDRDTVMRTFAERDEVAGWRRIGTGDSCPFCLMLIGRGAVYSKGTVDFQAHDSDQCMPEPLYRREAEPPEVQDLQRQWDEVTAGTTGGESLRAWRDFVEQQRQ